MGGPKKLRRDVSRSMATSTRDSTTPKRPFYKRLGQGAVAFGATALALVGLGSGVAKAESAAPPNMGGGKTGITAPPSGEEKPKKPEMPTKDKKKILVAQVDQSLPEFPLSDLERLADDTKENTHGGTLDPENSTFFSTSIRFTTKDGKEVSAMVNLGADLSKPGKEQNIVVLTINGKRKGFSLDKLKEKCKEAEVDLERVQLIREEGYESDTGHWFSVYVVPVNENGEIQRDVPVTYLTPQSDGSINIGTARTS